ncbi:hypothetical protein M0R45_009078 [Rubus argutus]|uniref:Uncharacterized protein n=1 Tax=Rubus argutus TaxID=59490 RepID=A0AAW1Y2J1_RUBAR
MGDDDDVWIELKAARVWREGTPAVGKGWPGFAAWHGGSDGVIWFYSRSTAAVLKAWVEQIVGGARAEATGSRCGDVVVTVGLPLEWCVARGGSRWHWACEVMVLRGRLNGVGEVRQSKVELRRHDHGWEFGDGAASEVKWQVAEVLRRGTGLN